ncbi:uncharacterized protein LOC142336802 isoform X2 [Convolutriloba macropyga]|uniref:uncharacterized protein LOC142336802 isoform X2 n=1 Tax=Convolutriloba macropyga TaxID=536237 RepID=UPI003F524A1B
MQHYAMAPSFYNQPPVEANMGHFNVLNPRFTKTEPPDPGRFSVPVKTVVQVEAMTSHGGHSLEQDPEPERSTSLDHPGIYDLSGQYQGHNCGINETLEIYKGDVDRFSRQLMMCSEVIAISPPTPPNETIDTHGEGGENFSFQAGSLQLDQFNDIGEHEDENSFDDNLSLVPNRNSDSDRIIDSSDEITFSDESNSDSDGECEIIDEEEFRNDENLNAMESSVSSFSDVSDCEIDDVIDDAIDDFEVVDPDDVEMSDSAPRGSRAVIPSGFKTLATSHLFTPKDSREGALGDVTRVLCYEQDFLIRSEYLTDRQIRRMNGLSDEEVRGQEVKRRNSVKEVSSRTREIVVDWLIQVQNYCGFQVESLFSGVAMFDIYNAVYLPDVETIQLVAITCILLATKVNEEDHADISKLIHLTEDSYSKEQVLNMEKALLRFFNYQLDMATPYSYRLLYCNHDITRVLLIDYLLELVMKEFFYTQYRPLQLVESCIWAALIVQSDPAVNKPCVSQSHPLGPPILSVLEALQNSSTDQRTGAREKYAIEKFRSISQDPNVINFSSTKVDISSNGFDKQTG